MSHADIVIVGGGIAGASLGAELAAHARVVLLEMEDRAGYHATGRSVAFWEESYGGAVVQPLTTASGPLLRAPDRDFHDGSFLSPRRTLHIGRAGDEGRRDALMAEFAGTVDCQNVLFADIVDLDHFDLSSSDDVHELMRVGFRQDGLVPVKGLFDKERFQALQVLGGHFAEQRNRS